jgi:hypothetical protein
MAPKDILNHETVPQFRERTLNPLIQLLKETRQLGLAYFGLGSVNVDRRHLDWLISR